jgi:hypothetical protein
MRQTKGKLKMCDKIRDSDEYEPAHGLSSAESAVHKRLVMLPCPWCGCTEVRVSVSEICCPIQYSARATCSDCYAEEPNGSGVHDSKEGAEKEALQAWNDRAT